MSRSHFSEGFLLGALVGLAAGLLFAPSSGEETRDKLKTLKRDSEDLIRDTREKTEDMIANTMSAIETGFEKLGKVVDEKKRS